MNGLFKFWFFSSHDPNSLLLLKVVIENIYPRKERAYQNGTWVPPNHNSTSFLLSSICSVRHFPSLLNIAVWEHHCNSSIVLVNGKIKHSVIIVCRCQRIFLPDFMTQKTCRTEAFSLRDRRSRAALFSCLGSLVFPWVIHFLAFWALKWTEEHLMALIMRSHYRKNN